MTASIRSNHHRDAIKNILSASINAVDPAKCVKHYLQYENGIIRIDNGEFDVTYSEKLYALGIGKASMSMAGALAEVLGDRLADALVITKNISSLPIPESISRRGYRVLEGGHPIPDKRSLMAGGEVKTFAHRVNQGDLLLCLLSGGGSALVTSPANGVSLLEMQSLSSALLACGASIAEINTVRRHLDTLKGGGLARLVSPASVISLVLSDVMGNSLEAIASGPTAPDPSTRQDALDILDGYGLSSSHQTIVAALRDVEETPKAENLIFDHVQNILIGDNSQALNGGLQQAEREGFHATIFSQVLGGDAKHMAYEMCAQFRRYLESGQTAPRPFCMIGGGETTVKLSGYQGVGGRNTEFALAAAEAIAGLENVMLITLATDGEDGPTNAAGAVVTGETQQRSSALGMHPNEFLSRHDSYTYFKELDDLLTPGPTGTNVNDLVFFFAL